MWQQQMCGILAQLITTHHTDESENVDIDGQMKVLSEIDKTNTH